MASLEKDNLVVFYYLSAFEIWHDESVGPWWEWPYLVVFYSISEHLKYGMMRELGLGESVGPWWESWALVRVLGLGESIGSWWESWALVRVLGLGESVGPWWESWALVRVALFSSILLLSRNIWNVAWLKSLALVVVILFCSTNIYFTISVNLKYGLMRGIAFGGSGLIKGRLLHIKLYLSSVLLVSCLQRVGLWWEWPN